MNYDIKKVGLPQSLREKADDIYTNSKAKINALSKLFFPFPDILKGQSDMVRLAVVLKSFERTHDFYKSKIISDDVFYDTIKDAAVWCENNQNNGLKNYRWLHNHASGNLFKIGRLQFQIYKAPRGLDYTKLPFKRGANLLYIHIPQGEKLTRESCTDSVRRAEEFFRSHFPNYEYDYFFCESWLLFPGNRSFMAKDSNIVKFMDLFTPAYSTENDSQAIERIFGERKNDINDYCEDTSLQKSAKEYMLGGNKLGFGTGYIKRQ